MARPKTEDQLKELVESVTAFDTFKIHVASKLTGRLNISEKMEFLTSGIAMGMSLPTVMKLCQVEQEEMNVWLKNEENQRIYDHAVATADAWLEYIAYQGARWDPALAIRLLEKRNPKRWQPTSQEEDDAEKLGEAAKAIVKGKVTMSQMLKEKPVQVMEVDDGILG